MDRRLVVAPRFGHWLKLLRTFAAIEQLDVAAMADISVGQVRALERGENVGLAYAEALIGAYRIVAEKDNNHELLQALDHEAFVADELG